MSNWDYERYDRGDMTRIWMEKWNCKKKDWEFWKNGFRQEYWKIKTVKHAFAINLQIPFFCISCLSATGRYSKSSVKIVELVCYIVLYCVFNTHVIWLLYSHTYLITQSIRCLNKMYTHNYYSIFFILILIHCVCMD